jgi:hypothetical protein
MMSLKRLCAVLAIGALFFTGSCIDTKDGEVCDGKVGFRLGLWGDTAGVEDFVALTEDETVIAAARAELLLPTAERTLHIHGLVARGGGGHNLDWDWHFIPGQWILVQESTEICDTRPSAIQASLVDWPDTVASIVCCPLSSYVKAEVQ